MRIFVSDLHLTDGTLGEAVSSEALVELLTGLRRPATGQIHLVLLGDIFELLRASAWSELWDEGYYQVAPWTAMSSGFRGFPPKAADCALGILRRITNRYEPLRKAIQERTEWLRVHYVPGNHDYMVQLIPEARREVTAFLSLDHNPDRPFPLIDTDDTLSIYATHGNTSDPLNWHREEQGKWAFGDAIVLRLVNQFIEQACDHLGQPRSGGAEIAKSIQDLDNVEPNEDLAVYFRCLLEEHFTNANQRKEILKIWQDCVSELLELADFRDRIYEDKHHDLVRTALDLSRSLSRAQLAVKLLAKYQELFGAEDADLQHAQEIHDRLQGKYRFIVFGHTHRPRIQLLASSRPAYYVNTGCWRRLVMRRKDLPEPQFRARRVATRFIIESRRGTPVYRLAQETEID